MNRFKIAVGVLFFLSGLCGLIYEVVWLRVLGLIFGNTTFALSTVLAAYMAGLGIGSRYFGRCIDEKGNELRVYGLLEIGIGIYCACTPFLWKLVEQLYIVIYHHIPFQFFQFSLVRFSLTFCLLFIPTFFMGGTLPVLSAWLSRRYPHFARQVSLVYGINTLGACAGVLVSSFFLLYYLGVYLTLAVAALCNCAIGAAALWLSREKGSDEITEAGTSAQSASGDAGGPGVPADPPVQESPWRFPEDTMQRFLFAGFCLSGFASMVYEICWTKVLALSLASSVYSFAIMLATFLVGMALGSILVALAAKKVTLDYSLFAFVQIAIAIGVLAGVNLLDDLPFYFLSLFKLTSSSGLLFRLAQFLLAGAVMILPTLFIGATFGIVASILYRRRIGAGTAVGKAYLANTLGCIAGSFAAGFLLIPVWGIQKTLIAAVFINLSVGLFIAYAAHSRIVSRRSAPHLAAGVCAILLLCLVRPWSKGILTSDIAIHPERYRTFSKARIENALRQRDIIFYKEGLHAIVSVVRGEGDNLYLVINGKTDASTGDMFTQLMLGHVPTLLHNAQGKKALVIGMGSASTLAALASYPYEAIDCIELEDAVVTAARYFSKENRNVLADPRVRVFTNDARNHLLMNPGRYDVIVSEPSNPWIAGEATLFTVEQFRLMKERLAPGGIVCQWCHVYSMSPDDLKMIIRTFGSVFPRVQLWFSSPIDLMLIGSERDIPYDYRFVEQQFATNRLLKNDLRTFGVDNAASFLASFMLSAQDLERLSGGALINTDNLPRLEFSAPRSLYLDTAPQNVRMLLEARSQPYPEMPNLPFDQKRTAPFHADIARGYLGKALLTEALKEVQQAMAINDQLPQVRFSLGLLYLKSGQADEAIALLSGLLTALPRSSELFFALGQALEQKERFGDSVQSYLRAAVLDQENPEYRVALSRCFIREKKYKEAVEQVSVALNLEGPKVETLLLLAEAYSSDGNHDAALSVLRAAQAINPRQFSIYERMIACEASFGRLEEALAFSRQADALFPNHPKNLVLMQRLYTALNRPREAEEVARKLQRYGK